MPRQPLPTAGQNWEPMILSSKKTESSETKVKPTLTNKQRKLEDATEALVQDLTDFKNEESKALHNSTIDDDFKTFVYWQSFFHKSIFHDNSFKGYP